MNHQHRFRVGLIGLLLLLAGCTTATSTARRELLPQHELQGRLLHLENMTQQRDSEIAQLREDLETERAARHRLEQRLTTTQAAAPSSSATMSMREVQRALKQAGFDPGKIDGKLGERTRAALRDFQRAQGLTADGRIGPQTLAKLKLHAN